MSGSGHCLFETAIGAVGIAWGDRGIVAVNLPEATPAATRRRLLARHPDLPEVEPPPAIRAIIDRIVALIGGEPVDLSDAPLDRGGLAGFHARVYDVALSIKPGETLTYGEVARRIGEPGAAQAVGQALGKNPFPIIVPCHRVLGSGGKTGGFSANGGAETKLRMLTIERAKTSDEPDLFGNLPLAVRPKRG